MKVIETEIPGVLIIETDVFGDHRGYFTETYSKPKYEKLGVTVDFVQDNMSFSAQKGTLRGLHWQNPPYAQSKLVSCTKGKVIDVAVDIRKGSPTYGKWVSVELSAENHRQFFIPQGFAHGFLTLTEKENLSISALPSIYGIPSNRLTCCRFPVLLKRFTHITFYFDRL